VDYDARNNRPVAQCFAGDDDLQAMMALSGWAYHAHDFVAFRIYRQRMDVLPLQILDQAETRSFSLDEQIVRPPASVPPTLVSLQDGALELWIFKSDWAIAYRGAGAIDHEAHAADCAFPTGRP
jgi:hypothetical protein